MRDRRRLRPRPGDLRRRRRSSTSGTRPRPWARTRPTCPASTPASTRTPARGVSVRSVVTIIEDLQAPPADTADAYLRLHLLSHRLVQPRTINLDGIFGVLPIVAWTNVGAVPVDKVTETRLHLRRKGQHLVVFGVDEFPRMVDYVVPDGVRIADADRVRLGRLPGARHRRHARGLRQLQRRHARHLDGRGPHLGRRRRRRRIRHRRRRVDHGHAVRRRHGGHQRRQGQPHRRQRRRGHVAGRQLRRRGRPLRHGRHEGDAARRHGRQGARRCPAPTTCCSAATPRPARSRSSCARAPGAASTPPCTPPTDAGPTTPRRCAVSPSSMLARPRPRPSRVDDLGHARPPRTRRPPSSPRPAPR